MFSHDGETTTVIRRSLSRVAHFDSALPDDLVEQLWNEPTALLEQGQILQSKGVRRTVLLKWASQPYVLKHYVEPTRRHAIKQLVLSSRAWRTWTVSHTLADAGIATPRPVACVENRWAALRRDSFLMYPYVEGRTLRSCLAYRGSEDFPPPDHFLQLLEDLWQNLAQVKASLADPNWGNFVIDSDGQLWVIDLDKARLHRSAFVAARRRKVTWRKVSRSSTTQTKNVA